MACPSHRLASLRVPRGSHVPRELRHLLSPLGPTALPRFLPGQPSLVRCGPHSRQPLGRTTWPYCWFRFKLRAPYPGAFLLPGLTLHFVCPPIRLPPSDFCTRLLLLKLLEASTRFRPQPGTTCPASLGARHQLRPRACRQRPRSSEPHRHKVPSGKQSDFPSYFNSGARKPFSRRPQGRSFGSRTGRAKLS